MPLICPYTHQVQDYFRNQSVDQFLKTSFPEREIDLHWQHRLVAIDAESLKVAIIRHPGMAVCQTRLRFYTC